MEQKEYWRVAMESIADGVIITDSAGLVTYLNPSAEKLCGCQLREATGKTTQQILRVFEQTTREPIASLVEQVFRERRAVAGRGGVLLRREGSEIPVDERASPVFDAEGSLTGVVVVFRDVSQSSAEKLLDERLAAIVESSEDIIVSKTLDGVITSWNRGAERVLGYSAEEMVGKHVSTIMPPDAIEDVAKILNKIRMGEKVEHYETRRIRKDGRIIDVSLTVSPVRDASGRIVGASKIGRDISQQKAIDAERREAERRKDEFLAMLAHELRNPLASISNAVQLFGKLETEDELEWAKEVVNRQVKHLARLIDDLLDVSRITRGKISLRRETVNLSPIVSSAVEAVRPLIEDRKHQLVVSLAAGGLQIDADPVRLEQILINLLTNAAKYTEAGGRITLSASVDGDQVVVSVQDTGLGIPAELMPRLFDLFVQGDRSIARSEGGLGIGLTLVKSLTELHGGKVTAESDGAGKGSLFTLRFPASKNVLAIRPSGGRSNLPRMARQHSRVLVVDDNVDTASGLARLLKLLGHEVEMAHDGEKAIERARALLPEVVLLDIGLPGMDGFEVVRQLRQEPCCRTSLIIAVSGYGQEEDRRKSEEAGFDHHLVKPIDLDSLLGLMAQ